MNTSIPHMAANEHGLLSLRKCDYGTTLKVLVTRYEDDVTREIASIPVCNASVQGVNVLDSGDIVVRHSGCRITVVDRNLRTVNVSHVALPGAYMFTFGCTIVTTHCVFNADTGCIYASRDLVNYRLGVQIGKWIVLQKWNGMCDYYY